MSLLRLLAIQDVDGCAELVALVFFDLAAADEGAEVGVGIGGGIEFTGTLFDVGDEFVGVVDVGDGASGGAGDTTDEALSATLAEHFTGRRVVGVDNDSVGDVAAKFGIGVRGGIEHFGVDAADAFFGIAGLDGGVGVFCDTNPAHGEEARGSLRVVKAEASFTSATAERFVNHPSVSIDDVHALFAGIDNEEPGGVVVGVARGALSGDGGFDFGPFAAE